MKAKIYSIKGDEIKEVVLPNQFTEPVREDIIRRAFLAQMSNSFQPHATYERAGKRNSAYVSKKRKSYKTSYGHNLSRAPKKVMSRRGIQFNWVGAFAPFARGGRMAHPPKIGKIIVERINDKERKKAIRSAISATRDYNTVSHKHSIEGLKRSLPIILESSAEKLAKTKQVIELAAKLGLNEELARLSVRKVRNGRGKMRGRKYNNKIGPLFVVSKSCALSKAVRNIPGADIINVKNLNVCALAPGSIPGRLVIFTEDSLNLMGKEALFK